MPKPELGTKRTCPSCGAAFYDLGKNPAVCPKCESAFQPPAKVRIPLETIEPRAAQPVESATAPSAPPPDGRAETFEDNGDEDEDDLIDEDDEVFKDDTGDDDK